MAGTYIEIQKREAREEASHQGIFPVHLPSKTSKKSSKKLITA
jgi:hypothetical protein